MVFWTSEPRILLDDVGRGLIRVIMAATMSNAAMYMLFPEGARGIEENFEDRQRA